MNITSVICTSQSYRRWRGEIGNYVLLFLFSVAFIFNINFGIIITRIRIRHKGKRKTLLIILELIIANFLILGAQLFNTSIRLFSSFQCYQKIIFYLTHQIGIQLTSTAILTLTYLNYLMVSQKLPVCQEAKRGIVNKLLCLQGISIFMGVVFVLLPIITDSKSTLVASILYETALGIICIRICCKCKKSLAVLNQVRLAYADKLKKEACVVRIVSLITTSLKLFSIFLYVIIASKKFPLVVLTIVKYVNTSLYLFPWILPSVYLFYVVQRGEVDVQCVTSRNTTDEVPAMDGNDI